MPKNTNTTALFKQKMTTAVCDKKNQGLTCEQVSNKCEDTGYNVGGEMYFAQQGLK